MRIKIDQVLFRCRAGKRAQSHSLGGNTAEAIEQIADTREIGRRAKRVAHRTAD